MAFQRELHSDSDQLEDGEEEAAGGAPDHPGDALPGPGLATGRLQEELVHLQVFQGASLVGHISSYSEVNMSRLCGALTARAVELLTDSEAFLQGSHRAPAPAALE